MITIAVFTTKQTRQCQFVVALTFLIYDEIKMRTNFSIGLRIGLHYTAMTTTYVHLIALLLNNYYKST